MEYSAATAPYSTPTAIIKTYNPFAIQNQTNVQRNTNSLYFMCAYAIAESRRKGYIRCSKPLHFNCLLHIWAIGNFHRYCYCYYSTVRCMTVLPTCSYHHTHAHTYFWNISKWPDEFFSPRVSTDRQTDRHSHIGRLTTSFLHNTCYSG